MTRQIRVTSAILKYPWLLPFVAVLLKKPSSVREVANELGCSRRLAVSGLYKLRVLGLIDKNDDGYFYMIQKPLICILRHNQWFLTIHGTTYIIAKVRRTRIKAYTLPQELVDTKAARDAASAILKHRIDVTRYLLSVASPYVGCDKNSK